MGFRSTFTTKYYDIEWPEWFRAKYADSIFFPKNNRGGICSSREVKTYTSWACLDEDIRLAIDWDRFKNVVFVVVYLHECGGITRCQIERDSIRRSEPNGWLEVIEPTHNYCYGCSDLTESHADN